MTRAAKILLGLLVTGGVVFGLVTAASRLYRNYRVSQHEAAAALREPAAQLDWRKAFGDQAETLAAYPAHDDNEAAVRLGQLAPGVGVDFAGTLTPNEASSALAGYIQAESQKAGGRVDPPPAPAQEYLDAHARGIGAVIELLTHAEPLAWKHGAWPTAPGPNLLALRRLNEILAAEALTRSSHGRDADADRALFAAWQLGASLRDRPETISQLITVAIVSIDLSIARRLSIDPAPWRTRLADHDYRASLMRAFEVESVQTLGALSTGSSRADRALRADYLDLQRASLIHLRDLPVTDQPADRFPQPDETLSVGATMAAISRPAMDSAVLSVDHLIVEVELTDRVLHARLLKARVGRWPARIPGLDVSRMAGVHWTYAVGADGRMTIALSRPLKGPSQPVLRYESWK